MRKKPEEEKNDNSRQKILDTAAALFAEKGYDGSRMDEIAERAQVNKALIYYYFKSKEKILEEILENATNDLIMEKKRIFDQVNLKNLKSRDSLTKIIDLNFKLLQKKNESFKIAFTEALKDDKPNDALFKMVDTLYEYLWPFVKEKGLKIEPDNDFQIASFFFGLAPILTAAILGEKWAKHHHIAMEEFNQLLSTQFKDVFMNYMWDILNKNK